MENMVMQVSISALVDSCDSTVGSANVSSGSNSLHCLYSSDRIYVLDFDLERDPPFKSPRSLLTKYKEELKALLFADNHRLGEIAKEGLILRLQYGAGSGQGKFVIFPEREVEACLARLSRASPLTEAEKRTLLQIVCGYSLRDSSIIDGVSYETKRVQLKAILAKSSMKRQIDISTFVMSQLLMGIEGKWTTEVKYAQHTTFTEYVSRYLPENVRTHTAIGVDGKHHRFLDMGPKNGDSLIVLHGHFLPLFSQTIVKYLQVRGVRLIWPLRNGMLGPQDGELNFDQHVSHATQSIELAKELFYAENQPVKIVGVGCAAHYCIAHAERYDLSASKYVFVGSSSSQARKLITTKNSAKNAGCISNVEGLRADYLLSLATRSLIDSSHLKKLLLGSYSASDPDQSLVEAVFSKANGAASLMSQFESSSISMAHDCSFHIAPDWAIAKAIKQPLVFIHGEYDGINDPSDLAEIGEQLGALFVKIPEAGHLVFHSHFNECLSVVVGKAARGYRTYGSSKYA